MIFNNAVTKITEISLFFANYEFQLNTIKESRRFIEITQKVMIQIKQLILLQKELQKNIQFSNKRSTLYVNKKEIKTLFLKEKTQYIY